MFTIPGQAIKAQIKELKSKRSAITTSIAREEAKLQDLQAQFRDAELEIKDSYKKAVATGMKEPDPLTSKGTKELSKAQRDLHKAIQVVKNSPTESEIRKKTKDMGKLFCGVQSYKDLQLDVEKAVEMRKRTSADIYNGAVRFIKSQFSQHMHNLQLASDFWMLRATCEVKLMTNNVEVSQLSGGERSKTMVCLIAALWKAQHSPFICLDEWDVMLDDDARLGVERLLVIKGVQYAKQCFFINPSKSGTNVISYLSSEEAEAVSIFEIPSPKKSV